MLANKGLNQTSRICRDTLQVHHAKFGRSISDHILDKYSKCYQNFIGATGIFIRETRRNATLSVHILISQNIIHSDVS